MAFAPRQRMHTPDTLAIGILLSIAFGALIGAVLGLALGGLTYVVMDMVMGVAIGAGVAILRSNPR